MKDIQFYKNKKVKLLLKNQFRYVGIIIGVSDDDLTLLDKWNSNVRISLDEISLIQEVVDL